MNAFEMGYKLGIEKQALHPVLLKAIRTVAKHPTIAGTTIGGVGGLTEGLASKENPGKKALIGALLGAVAGMSWS